MSARRQPALKYAVVERERRFLVDCIPEGVVRVSDIVDRYVVGTRLRLRQVRPARGTGEGATGDEGTGVVRKLGHKVRLDGDASGIACTSMYLDDAEWRLLSRLPAHVVAKRRHHVERDDVRLVVDELADGTLLAEIDDRDRSPVAVPRWLGVVADVTSDEKWTGAAIAVRLGAPA